MKKETASPHSLPALILLPGLMCDATFWQPLTNSQPCQVVDYGDANSITAMAEAALAVSVDDFVVAGHSLGGRVALEVARLAPERVKKIILIDTGYLPKAFGAPGDIEAAGRMALVDIARRQGVRVMCKEWVKGMVHPDRLNDAPLMDAILSMFERKTAERFARQQEALLTRPDASGMLAALRVPTLLLCGRQDAWANVAQHAAMHALAPKAQFSVIEDAGHMVLMEQPVETLRVIHQFLEESLG